MLTNFQHRTFHRRTLTDELPPKRRARSQPLEPDNPPPPSPPAEPDEPNDPDDLEVPCTDDAHWDVFIADDDDRDPLPDFDDFWIEDPEEMAGGEHSALDDFGE